MYIFKQAKIGGEVCAHQDGAFLYTEPQSVIGFWWALDDCTLNNGCLWVIPGSHSIGVNRRYKRKEPPLIGTEFVPPEPIAFDLTGAIPLVIPQGTLVILHNALVHYSAENNSDAPRHAYSGEGVTTGSYVLSNIQYRCLLILHVHPQSLSHSLPLPFSLSSIQYISWMERKVLNIPLTTGCKELIIHSE
jgi:ectoine hydroxylase-related dioxygenase (phytanoyl-CoA dioxygenase family)